MFRNFIAIAIFIVGFSTIQARAEEEFFLESYPMGRPASSWYRNEFFDHRDFGLSNGNLICTYDDEICTIERRRWTKLTEEVIFMNARLVGDVQFQINIGHDPYVFKTDRSNREHLGVHLHCRPVGSQLECSLALRKPNENFYVGTPSMPARKFITVAGNELRGKFEIRFKRTARANDSMIETKVKFANREIGSFSFVADKDFLNIDYLMGMIAYTDGPTTSRLIVDQLGAQAQTERVPYFCYYDPKADARRYISDFGEHFQSSANRQLSPEGIGFYGFRTRQPGMVPLYRLRNPNTGNKYFTVDTNERNSLIRLGWISEGEDGNLYPAGSNRGKSISRLYNKLSGAHLFTDNRGLADAILRSYSTIWFEHALLGEGGW